MTFKMPEGGAQAAMAMIAPPELEKDVDALWASHAEWIKSSHHKEGAKAMLFYHQCKGKEVKDFLSGPAATPTGNLVWTITEFYADRAGLDDHFALFHAGSWAGGTDFSRLMETGKVVFTGRGYGLTHASMSQSEAAKEDEPALKMPSGGAQAAMTMIAPPELETDIDAMWASHAEWIKSTHYNSGRRAILFYHQCKGKEVEDFTSGPAATPTGNLVWTITEFYADRAGLDDHFALFHAGSFAGGAEFNRLMDTGKVQFNGHGYGQTIASIAQSELAQKGDGQTIASDAQSELAKKGA